MPRSLRTVARVGSTASPLVTRGQTTPTTPFKSFRGPRDVIKYVYTDNSKELIKAVSDLGLVHGTSTPGRPQTNGVAERAVRTIVEGTRTVLEQAGFPPSFWTFACRHFAFAANVAVVDGDSAWHLRHKEEHFRGPLHPFGCLVDFMPLPSLVPQLPKSAGRTVPGVLLGYVLLPGGLWSGDFLVAPLSEFRPPGVANSDAGFPGEASRLAGGGGGAASSSADAPMVVPVGGPTGWNGRVRVQRVKEGY